VHWIKDVRRDVVVALRRLLHAPVFTLFSVVTLAFGIGATTAIYSVIYAAVLRPLAAEDSGRLVNIYHSPVGLAPSNLPAKAFAFSDYEDLRHSQRSFSGITAWARFRQQVVAGGAGEFMSGEMVGGDYFEVLGIDPLIGRLIQPQDDRPGATPVVVISEQYWRRRFGGDSLVVGRTLTIDGAQFEIVGVAPARFRGVDIPTLAPTPMWIALSSGLRFVETDGEALNSRQHRWLWVMARLKPGVELAQASAEVAAIGKGLDAAYPLAAENTANRRRADFLSRRLWTVIPTDDIHVHLSLQGIAVPIAWAAMCLVTLVLMVACTNIANLLLARGAARRHEIAVRLAMGASRSRLLGEHVIESGLIALAGAAGGILVARGGMSVLTTQLEMGRGLTLSVSPVWSATVLVLAVAAALLAFVVCALVPAFHATRVDVRELLASDTAGAVPRWRGRRALIAMQVSVSLVLVMLAGLYVQQIRAAANQESGIDLDRLAIVQVDFGAQAPGEVRAREFVAAVASEARRIRGVEAAALSSGLPSAGTGATASVTISEAMGSLGAAKWQLAQHVSASPEIFGVLGLDVLRGRGFGEEDTAGSAPVAVISERTARTLFGATNALGRDVLVRLRSAAGQPPRPDETRRVVGIVRDVNMDSTGFRGAGLIMVPLSQQFGGDICVIARASGDPGPVVGSLRAIAGRLDPEMAVVDSGTGMSFGGRSDQLFRIFAGLSGLLGIAALVLAAIGLHGVLSDVVARRSREVGVRLALGATPARIVRMILIEGTRPVLAGIVLGLTLGTIARMAMRPVFVRILPASDVTALAVVPALFVAVALLACYLPARRASGADPNTALRHL
jgi:predicted permease